jgi:hypothetical protein
MYHILYTVDIENVGLNTDSLASSLWRYNMIFCFYCMNNCLFKYFSRNVSVLFSLGTKGIKNS